MFLRDLRFLALLVAVEVTLRNFALVTSLAAFAVAALALAQARRAIRTVQQDVLPHLRAMTGDESVEGT